MADPVAVEALAGVSFIPFRVALYVTRLVLGGVSSSSLQLYSPAIASIPITKLKNSVFMSFVLKLFQ